VGGGSRLYTLAMMCACQGRSWEEDGLKIRWVVGTIGAHGIGLGASMDGGYTWYSVHYTNASNCESKVVIKKYIVNI